jgi:formylglycine-generating enzyme required for sulfatase activity
MENQIDCFFGKRGMRLVMKRFVYFFILILGLVFVHHAQATDPRLSDKEGKRNISSGVQPKPGSQRLQKSGASKPSQTTLTERHRRYIAHSNGIVLDTRNGIEWFPGPDKDTDWNEATSWVQNLNLDGGGWRMPTMGELSGLYQKGTGKFNMTPLLKTNGWYVWSNKTYGSDGARGLDFEYYSPYRSSRCYSPNCRVFAIRFRKDDRFSGESARVEKEGLEFQKEKAQSSRKHRNPLQQRAQTGPLKGRIYVEMTPEFATVRILNTGARFSQGMALGPGRYHVEVSADGHETKDLWVSLGAGKEETVRFNLARVSEALPAAKRTSPESSLGNSLGMEFVYIPSGSFMMGSPSDEMDRNIDERQHHVTLTKGFYIQKAEVTQGQWERVMGSNPSIFSSCGQDCPVEYVSWHDCQQFIKKLNQAEGTIKYRLPTEAEWEYACRAGTSDAFAGDLEVLGWYASNSGVKTYPIGRKQPNTRGLYDMHGNVWEWCQDCHGQYPSNAVTNPVGPSSSPARVYRGGSFSNDAGNCRSANRKMSDPSKRYINLGFRLAFSSGQ